MFYYALQSADKSIPVDAYSTLEDFINLYIFSNIELIINSQIFQLIINIPATNKFSLHLTFNYI